jgi:ABC-2 type transport system permease protein
MLIKLLKAEWIKLAHRPMTNILLLIFLLMTTLILALYFVVVGLALGSFGLQVNLFNPVQIEQYRLQLSFPGIFGAILGQVNGIGGICAIIITAGAIGSEYNWGTLRAQLARQPNRAMYLTAKLIAIMLLLLIAILLAQALGVVLALVFGGLLGSIGSVSAGDLLNLPIAILRSLYVLLPYVLFTAACSIFGRSVLAGTAGGMIFLTTDLVLGGLSFLPNTGGMLAFIYNLLVQQNINSLVVSNAYSFGLDPSIALSRFLDLAILPSQLQAVIVIAVYCLSFGSTAYYWFLKRDLTGAA